MEFSKEFIIVDYQPEDYKVLKQLWELTGLENPARGDSELIIKKTILAGGRLLVLKEISTAALIGSSWLTTDARRLYLHHFGIHPAYQGHGLANHLMNFTLDIAKHAGLQIKLEVNSQNMKAIGLYEKYGFKYLGEYFVYINREIGLK